jgi:anti-sigma-K factor RskA
LKHERLTEEIRELSALYALGALTQHEARSFELHLRDGCSVCKSELNRLEHAAAGIGLAAEEVETPEYLRDLLLARIERESPAPVPVVSPEPNKPVLKAPSQIDESHLEKKGRKSNPNWGLRGVLIILVLTNLFALIKLRSLWSLNTALQTSLSTATDDLRRKLEDQKNKPEDFAQILEVTGKAGMRIAWLAGQPSAQSSSGMLFWDTKQHRYLLMGSFPPIPQGKAYQLWLVTPAKKISAGLIKANPDGSCYTAMPISENPSDAVAAGVTLEPDSGSPLPTTRFYALGQFH